MSARHSLIFDFDGTLCDSLEEFFRVMNELSDEYGYRRVARDEIPWLRGLEVRELIKHLKIPMLKIPSLAARARLELSKRLAELRPFEGIREILNEIRSGGAEIGILSSNAEGNIRAFLEATGIQVDFVCAESSIFGKGRLLKRILKGRRHSIDPERAAYVGDEPRDIRAARSAGLRAVAVGWGYNTPELLSAAAPDALLRERDELLQIASELKG